MLQVAIIINHSPTTLLKAMLDFIDVIVCEMLLLRHIIFVD